MADHVNMPRPMQGGLSLTEFRKLADQSSRRAAMLGSYGGRSFSSGAGESFLGRLPNRMLIKLTAVNNNPNLGDFTPAYSWEEWIWKDGAAVQAYPFRAATFANFPAQDINGSALADRTKLYEAWVSNDGRSLLFDLKCCEKPELMKNCCNNLVNYPITTYAEISTDDCPELNGLVIPLFGDGSLPPGPVDSYGLWGSGCYKYSVGCSILIGVSCNIDPGGAVPVYLSMEVMFFGDLPGSVFPCDTNPPGWISGSGEVTLIPCPALPINLVLNFAPIDYTTPAGYSVCCNTPINMTIRLYE